MEVSPELQRDFSLHHTLSLYLLDTLPRLDRESPTYALDVITLVESILEDPGIVLLKQLDALKTKRLAELKAQGVEYAERMEELEKLEYPKPHRDFIYGTFDAFAAKHPWVGHENIRPKSVARDMLERFATFNDYVREYELQRSEGVLLRYLTDAYKTLAQTVPESYRDEALDEALQSLRRTVREADSSLLDEWERLQQPDAAPLQPAATGGPVGPTSREIAARDSRRAPPPPQGHRREGLGRRSGLPRARPRLDRRVTGRRGRALLRGPRADRPHPRRPPPEHGRRPLRCPRTLGGAPEDPLPRRRGGLDAGLRGHAAAAAPSPDAPLLALHRIGI